MTVRCLLCIVLFVLAAGARAEAPVVDTSFGSAGWQRLFEPGGDDQYDTLAGLARTMDGGYVVAIDLPGGAAPGGLGSRIGLVRLDRNGQRVTGFGVNGMVLKDA